MWEYRLLYGGAGYVLLLQTLCRVLVVIYVPSREPHRVTIYQAVDDLTIVVCGRHNVDMRGRFALKVSHFPIWLLCYVFGVSGPGFVRREGGISSPV